MGNLPVSVKAKALRRVFSQCALLSATLLTPGCLLPPLKAEQQLCLHRTACMHASSCCILHATCCMRPQGLEVLVSSELGNAEDVFGQLLLRRYGHVESVRLRSLPLQADAGMPRRAAISSGKVDEAGASANAYIVFQNRLAARGALAHNMQQVGTCPHLLSNPGLLQATFLGVMACQHGSPCTRSMQG